jgi:acetone carboxylase gamma subunit
MGWPEKMTLKDMIEGKLVRQEVVEIQRRQKDPDRFEKILEIEQERVPWDDKIILPMQEKLYVVLKKDGRRVVKCFCGHEFCEPDRNWKEESLVYERHPADGEVFVGMAGADPKWMVLREFYCPGCGAQLEVEGVPHGYPFVFNFLPDIDAFYKRRPELKKKVFGK